MNASIFNWKKKTKTDEDGSLDKSKAGLEKEKGSKDVETNKETLGSEPEEVKKAVEKTKTRKAGSSDQPKTDLGKEKVSAGAIPADKEDLSWVIISPRITEKSAFLTGVSGYTFNVDSRANKVEIKKAIKAIYGVDLVKITTSTKRARKTIKRGRKVHVSGGKKAVAFLRKGDKIEFV